LRTCSDARGAPRTRPVRRRRAARRRAAQRRPEAGRRWRQLGQHRGAATGGGRACTQLVESCSSSAPPPLRRQACPAALCRAAAERVSACAGRPQTWHLPRSPARAAVRVAACRAARRARELARLRSGSRVRAARSRAAGCSEAIASAAAPRAPAAESSRMTTATSCPARVRRRVRGCNAGLHAPPLRLARAGVRCGCSRTIRPAVPGGCCLARLARRARAHSPGGRGCAVAALAAGRTRPGRRASALVVACCARIHRRLSVGGARAQRSRSRPPARSRQRSVRHEADVRPRRAPRRSCTRGGTTLRLRGCTRRT
jgi:hypothetical protein